MIMKILNLTKNLKQVMFKDLFKFIHFMILNNNSFYIFFNESEFTYKFLEAYINKRKKKKILIFSFVEIKHNDNKNINSLYLKSNFFRELFFIFCKCKYFYSTTPDLNYTQFKKSKNKNIKYIYLQHSMFSLNAIYKAKSFNNFDAVQCVSEYQKNEIIEINTLYKKKIKYFKSKYLFPYLNLDKENKFKVLIAPSWATKFYISPFFENLLQSLNENNITFKFRRHNMSIKNKELSQKIIDKYKIKFYEDKVVNYGEFEYLISDWSGIIMEYFIITKKKSFLINIEQKIRNDKYNLSKIIPTENLLREKISHTYYEDKIHYLVKDIMKNQNLQIDNSFFLEKFY